MYHRTEKHFRGDETVKIPVTSQYSVSDLRIYVRNLIVIGWKLGVEDVVKKIGRHHIRLNEISKISAFYTVYFMILRTLLVDNSRIK